jgi:hypothetical protein
MAEPLRRALAVSGRVLGMVLFTRTNAEAVKVAELPAAVPNSEEGRGVKRKPPGSRRLS